MSGTFSLIEEIDSVFRKMNKKIRREIEESIACCFGGCRMITPNLLFFALCRRDCVKGFLLFLQHGIKFDLELGAFQACEWGAVNILTVLCVLGANISRPINVCLRRMEASTLTVLLENGVKLSAAKPGWAIKQEFHDLERGVLSCKNVIVILLGLKKRQIPALVRLDRFLIQQELAAEIWSTRRHSDETWQKIH